jgi:hypothetical protein
LRFILLSENAPGIATLQALKREPGPLKSKTPAQGRRFDVSRVKLLSYNVNNQFSEHFAVNLEVHFVLTSGTQNTVRQTNFALSHFNASCSYCISDIAGTDGTEQFTFVASFGNDGNSAQCVD